MPIGANYVYHAFVDQINQTETDTQNIRIVIRDVDPPLAANVFRGVMHVVCAALLLCVCAIGIPRIFGIQEFNVLTGSMTPAYPVGTLVFAVPTEPEDIQVGDAVSYIMNEQLDVITHRVVENNAEDQTITTRGDANNSNDAPCAYANIIGVVKFSVPGVGGAIDYFTNNMSGRVVGLTLLGMVVALTLLSETICNRLSSQTYTVIED